MTGLPPAVRIARERWQTITRRKQLAQEIRNELAVYKRLASEDASYRDRVIARIDAKFNELLSLEGYSR